MNKDIKEQLDILKDVKANIKQSIIGRKQEVPDDNFSTLVESCIAIDGDDFSQHATNKDMNASIAKKGDNALVYSKDTNTLGGLYKHNGTTYSAVPTSFTANKNLVYGGNYLGSTGVETGTMDNFTPRSQAELHTYLDILNNINENGIIINNDCRNFPYRLSNYPPKILVGSECTSLELGWNAGSELDNIKTITISSLGESNLTSIHDMCRGFRFVTKIDASGLLTPKVTNMMQSFSTCKKCTEIDISNFDTSNVTNFALMFNECQSLKTLKAPTWNTSKATDMRSMFECCYAFESINEHIVTFDTSNVVDTSFMFYYCDNKTLSVSHFDTSNVKNMSLMFGGCNFLTDIDISNWNLSNVTNMRAIFRDCFDLSEESISCILKALPTATALETSNKTLKHIELSQAQAEICTTLEEWQACVDSGWTTGY